MEVPLQEVNAGKALKARASGNNNCEVAEADHPLLPVPTTTTTAHNRFFANNNNNENTMLAEEKRNIAYPKKRSKTVGQTKKAPPSAVEDTSNEQQQHQKMIHKEKQTVHTAKTGEVSSALLLAQEKRHIAFPKSAGPSNTNKSRAIITGKQGGVVEADHPLPVSTTTTGATTTAHHKVESAMLAAEKRNIAYPKQSNKSVNQTDVPPAGNTNEQQQPIHGETQPMEVNSTAAKTGNVSALLAHEKRHVAYPRISGPSAALSGKSADGGGYGILLSNVTEVVVDQATTPTDNNNNSGLLAVATQVEEEHKEPTQIASRPAAARPDKASEDNGAPSPSLLILVLIVSLFSIGIVVGCICGAGLCSNKEGDVGTQAPTSFRYFILEDIQNRIDDAFGPDYFPKNDETEPTQPKFKALYWIVFEDPLQLNADANNLLQRFILSLTYFETSRESNWLDCGPSTTTTNDESCRIHYFNSESWGSRWLAGVHECQWGGIFCDGEKYITELQLRGNGLNGPLPTELASLTALELINFEGNQLTGSIPVELFRNKLSSLQFANNSLTGTVPTEVGLFDGSSLDFASNSLSGSIPTELFQARTGNRLYIVFDDNELTGTLPTEIGALHGRNRVDLHLQGNPLHGTIPSEIGLLRGKIGDLDMSWTNMDGSLPEEFFTKCTNLVSLKASNSGLTGTISSGLQRLTKLQNFDISNNKFHGTIPAQLSALTRLQRFILTVCQGMALAIP
ncbi:leucine Rich Repeat [Seminavis robusta]|uniref:Leucine Rich Repeat n=1 Tax=Seminavis robusta TaxID=568900 RepID=A0A9N8HUM0_9STRA|nr:leucine Rich Repeat [Seminavis robusta]|eukprot:Sro1772_g296700.1 leucine Rich Repeat (737) ;mRNA; r:13641-16125